MINCQPTQDYIFKNQRASETKQRKTYQHGNKSTNQPFHSETGDHVLVIKVYLTIIQQIIALRPSRVLRSVHL